LKIGTSVVLLILVLVGVFTVDETEFNFNVKVPNVKDFAGCAALCQQTLSDTELAATLGGKGVCTSVEFVECSTKASYPKLKLKKCAKVVAGTSPTKDSAICSFDVSPATWKPYATIVIFVLAALGCFEGGPPDILLIGAGCILTIMGIITRKELFAGMTNSGVLGLAVLSPISKAIGDSGIMEKLVGVMLGQPKSFGVALFRMMIPVALFSAFLSNTATVAIMIPIIVSWSLRLQVHPGQFLMPLSFAAQLGGSMTLLGSSHCLVAQGTFASSGYNMEFFDLAPIGAMLTVLTSLAIWLVIQSTTLLRSSAQAPQLEVSEDSEEVIMDMYKWPFVVNGESGLVGKTTEEAGFNRLPGVAAVRHADGIARVMQAHDTLIATCSERGIVALRKIPGVAPRNQNELAALGRQRHHRFLYEVGIRPESKIFEKGLPSSEELRHMFVAGFVAGPKIPYNPAEAESTGEAEDAIIGGNCVILLEADERAVADKAVWSNEFPLIHKVHFSSPPRQGLPVDKWRTIATFLGFLILIGLVTAKQTKLDYGGGILCLVYLFIRSLTTQDFMKSFNPSILGTIVGALAMGAALERSGFASFLSSLMVKVAEPFGSVGMTVMIYIVSWLMGLVINNSAIVAILGPMLISAAEKDSSLEIKGLAWALVYAAGTCFTTPLGYQTNLMVIPEGKYTFGDFARFGMTIQFMHFLLTVLFITIFVPALV